ncbi:MAG: hypothetical protein IPL28_15460 [Chloroflexi bacterium]|nr:hypothetical protein [Chloroflexota bacterium]
MVGRQAVEEGLRNGDWGIGSGEGLSGCIGNGCGDGGMGVVDWGTAVGGKGVGDCEMGIVDCGIVSCPSPPSPPSFVAVGTAVGNSGTAVGWQAISPTSNSKYSIHLVLICFLPLVHCSLLKPLVNPCWGTIGRGDEE